MSTFCEFLFLRLDGITALRYLGNRINIGRKTI